MARHCNIIVIRGELIFCWFYVRLS